MSYYDYDKFVHPVPLGYVIPAHTPMRRVGTISHTSETFFTAPYDFPVYDSEKGKVYLTYDITKPKLPKEINSVIYNVRTDQDSYALAVYQGSRIWSAFSDTGERTSLYTPEIEYFDTTPPKEEAGDDDE